MTPDRLAKAAVAALENVKGHDIVVFDVRKLTPMFDRMVIASGDSSRQVNALARNVQNELKAAGAKVYGVEGEANGEWVLVDLGPVLVHIMHPTIREYYNLEELWGGTPKPARAAAPRKRAPARASRSG
jgi:ribosome-associated protein